MDTNPPDAVPVHQDKKGTELLANERTFLAWIRTAVAVISLGFVVSRFSLWLHEITSTATGSRRPIHVGASLLIGEMMMGFGGLLSVLAAWRYHVVNRDIERGCVSADRGLIVLITTVVGLLAAALIVYMLATNQ